MAKIIHIDGEAKKTFHNQVNYCIGTGRMFLALHKEYHDQLEKVQKEIGFQYIRGHGLFCDDMGIYQEYEENGETKVEYNFTYVDRVFDDYLSMGLKPFVELGFMPSKLASGKKTVFYWKGNITPPRDYSVWADLVKHTILHWIERYGRQEVITWPFEVWNEPNLWDFWLNADMNEYFKLYQVTSETVKSIDKELRIGGPAICGVDDERWLREFLTFCSKEKVPVDFVTRHFYTTEAPEWHGKYAYQELREHTYALSELQVSRDIIDSFECYKGMEMHITEFNTSYLPMCPLHDTNLNAAYVARLLSTMGDTCMSYSYWTFGDVFEEKGIPSTLFHGGFGLLANGGIKKPVYWTFQFFNELGGTCLFRNEDCVVTKTDEGKICGVLWNPIYGEKQNICQDYEFQIPVSEGEYVLIQKSVAEDNCNPRKTWLHIGSPATPDQEQIELINQTASPVITTKNLHAMEDKISVKFSVKQNEVRYFEIRKIQRYDERGLYVE